MPSLRRFGRRARIVEVDEAPGDAASGGPGASTSTATAIPTDHDGVELGEMAVGDAPDPRPAPRFDGRVLHRPDRSGGSGVVWIVWALLAIALVALVVLLLTGVIGGTSHDAASSDHVGRALALISRTRPIQEVVLT